MGALGFRSGVGGTGPPEWGGVGGTGPPGPEEMENREVRGSTGHSPCYLTAEENNLGAECYKSFGREKCVILSNSK